MRAISDMRDLGLHRNAGLQAIFGSSVLMIMGASLVYPILPVIAESLMISDGQIGLVLSAFALPAVFLAPVAGTLSDLRGRKFVLVSSLLLYGFAGGAIALVDSFEVLLLMRALQGVAYAGVMPLVVVLIGDTFSGDQEVTAQGTKVVFDRLALLTVPAAAGALGAIAWQLPFVLYASAIPMAFLAWWRLPESVLKRNSSAPRYIREVFAKSIQPRSLAIFSMSSLRFFLELAFFTYLPIFAISDLGVTVSRGGLLFTVFAIGSIATAATVKMFVARVQPAPAVVIAFGVQAACLVLASLVTSVLQLGAILLIFGLANGVISPTQKSLLTQSVPKELRGGFVAADRVAQNTAKFLSPLIAGAVVVMTNIATMFLLLGLLAGAWALVMGMAFSFGWVKARS